MERKKKKEESHQRNTNRLEKHKIAPGMEEELARHATNQEKRQGRVTKVTTMSWDEVED